MDKIQKELLTKDNIRKDLKLVANEVSEIKSETRLTYIVPSVLMAAILGFTLKSILLPIPFLAFAVYHVAIMGREAHEANLRRRTILLGELSLSVEELSHFSEEIIYEPHTHRRSAHYHKTVKFIHFTHTAWRIPRVRYHYAWSNLYYMSTQGLENTSLVGEKFYIVSLSTDSKIQYIYNTNLFELKKDEWE